MKNTNVLKRTLSLLLCLTLLVSNAPLSVTASANAPAQYAVTETIADPGTADSWETMMGTAADGNRYAGRVWADKSVYKNGDTVVLNSRGTTGSSFTVSLKEDEAFQVVFSVLGSTMSTTQTSTSTGPMDVVLIMDTSTSMDDEDSNGVTRLERTISAANSLLDDLLTINNVRIAIVTYNRDSEIVLPLADYSNGVDLVVTDYYNNYSSDAGVVMAYDNNRKLLGKDGGYTSGTNLQAGIDRGFNILASATDVDGRAPVAIVLTDGQSNRASQEGFYELSTHNDADGTGASNRNLYLSTLLNAAYNKTKIEAHYGKDATIYTVGADVSGNTVAQLLMNPADSTNGFRDYGTSGKTEITQAYRNFQTWASGKNVTYNNWTFDHNYPKQNGVITDAKIAANIYYADTYYDVSSAELEDTFQQIYEELSSGAFNPITSSTSVDGATGVDGTPLVYVDFIGEHMEIKEIEAVTLFGASYGVINNADGTYTVTAGTGTNPTTNETWKTDEDIRISVTEDKGIQKLEIRIKQEILPILIEQVASETAGDVTAATITEILQEPLRVYYTVGVDSDILLPNGEVDVSKIQNYENMNDTDGTVTFYSNQFGVMNPAAGTQGVIKGDAHVGFRPSAENRYYYHQTNQGIFTKITNKSDGSAVTIPENNEYGIVWDEAKYDLTWMTYDAYKAAEDDTKVYTYVSYYHPTPITTDAANAAEAITYLVYTDWKYLKESVAFYDATAETYLNNGIAIAQEQVESAVAAYIRSNPGAQIYAVLGVGSHRTSRLHNMTVNKAANNTQTALERYAPEYTYDTAAIHNGNDVVVWLGNNGKVTMQIDTGIALTKAVTEEIGNPDDTYALTVQIAPGVTADPEVVDAAGNKVTNVTYSGNKLTVPVKAGETVYISGIPGGTVCDIGEEINGDYYIESQTHSVTVPLVSQVLSGAAQYAPAIVTNAPNKYGNLFITKEITSDHAVPGNVLETRFDITVDLGTTLAGQKFFVEDSAHTAPYEVTVNNEGKLTFSIKARQTVEILQLPAGTNVTVTEAAPGSHFTASYRTRNHSGENPDSDPFLVIPGGGSATAVVLNHYTPAPASVALDVVINKTFADASVASRLQGGAFSFLVEKYIPATQAWQTLATETIHYNAGEYGLKTATIANVLQNEVYTAVGTYSYKVTEVKGGVENVSYDRAVYTIDVIVTDNGGQLAAKVVGVGNAELTDQNADGTLDYITAFTNTYDTVPVSMDITKLVNNTSADATVSAAGFQFKAVTADASGVPLNPAEPETAYNTVFTDAAGVARISGVYTRAQAGTHYYLVYEVDDGRKGWTYSQAQYLVTVVVADDLAGKLTATMTITPHNEAAKNDEKAPTVTGSNNGQLFFTNTYDPEDVSVNLDGAVKKQLTGKTLESGMFTFCVLANGEGAARNYSNALLTGTNDWNGNVNFVDFNDVLSFDSVGKYEYDVVEQIPDGAVYNPATGKMVLNGMQYDTTVYNLVVEVTNNAATGKLEAEYYFEDAVADTVVFHNNYRVTPTSYTLGGHKILHGRAPREGEFSFALYQNGTKLETATNKADGTFRFHPISYTEAGIYTYTIRETEPAVKAPGVTYDGVAHPIEVVVEVRDNNGVLEAHASVSNADIRFENTYQAAPATVTFNGTKTLKGGTLADNDFAFLLYQTDRTFDITKASAAVLDTAENENGVFAFTRSLAAPGTYYFVLAEDISALAENIVYDRTQHTFTVQVSDIGDGQLRAAITDMTTGNTTDADASVAAAVAFTNATFDEATQKDVFAANTSDNVDGKKVQAGDVLTYEITYTNYTGHDVVVDILDTIPRNTTYVEGTATHNGTYAGEHINWVLNVAKGESVTVRFDVKVNVPDAVVANTAIIRDGVNTYTTNEVVNHTYETPGAKDVALANAPEISVDGQKVNVGDELLYKITYTNYTGKDAAVTITDKIPANTAYVADSADTGGVFADGALVWNLTVAAGAEVTVSFKVKAEVAQAQITNSATILENNDYQFTTNTVTNNTITEQPPIQPEQPESTQPEKTAVAPNVPKTGDDTNLALLAGLLLLSGAAMTALIVTAKKKEQSA